MAHVDLDVIPKPPTHLLRPQAAQHPSVQSFLNSTDPILDLNIAAFSGQRVYELRDGWILDNGSNAHVSNIREQFETFTLIEGKNFKTGDIPSPGLSDMAQPTPSEPMNEAIE